MAFVDSREVTCEEAILSAIIDVSGPLGQHDIGFISGKPKRKKTLNIIDSQNINLNPLVLVVTTRLIDIGHDSCSLI